MDVAIIAIRTGIVRTTRLHAGRGRRWADSVPEAGMEGNRSQRRAPLIRAAEVVEAGF